MERYRHTLPHALAFFLVLVCAGIWSAVYAHTPGAPGVLTVAVLDVGQGDSIYIESPTGVQVLIDGGPGSAVLEALPEVLPLMDHSLDAIIATHPDADHISGLIDIVKRYEVGVYLYPGISKDTATAQALERAVDKKNITRVLARRGMTLELGGGAVLRILYPEKDVSYVPSDKANEGGVVAQLIFGESEILFMADVGSGVEARLVEIDEALESEVLKVGHHGSRFSSSASFVRVVSPEVAVISVGKNSYGHPTPQALSVLETVGAEILRTDQEGTILLQSAGKNFFRVR